ncbi:FHA domain protein [compost metagenome]
MELALEVISAQQFTSGFTTRKTFRQAGGIIGRAEDCDWTIPDRNRVLSNRHALITYADGAFYLTDISKNGIRLGQGGPQLPKDRPQRIDHGTSYWLGEFEVRARLVRDPALFDDIGQAQPADSIIPDDAFLDLDPLVALAQQDHLYADTNITNLIAHTFDEPAQLEASSRVETESLNIPELIEAPSARPPQDEQSTSLPSSFWEGYGAALGISLGHLDEDQRQDLALHAAHLLRLSVTGLQQSLRTRSELKNELRLALTSVHNIGSNPLKHAADSEQALSLLLRSPEPGRLSSEQALGAAFRDLQAHQVALLAASRAAMRQLFEKLSPERLALRFEREGRLLPSTSGSHWRAYRRLYRALQQEDDWAERLFARDFAQAYEEQVRLISTLTTSPQG